MLLRGRDHVRDRDRGDVCWPMRSKDRDRAANQRARSHTGSRVNTCLPLAALTDKARLMRTTTKFTSSSRSDSGFLWDRSFYFIHKIESVELKEIFEKRKEIDIIIVTETDMMIDVKFPDKTECFMQITDNILIFILTASSSYCLIVIVRPRTEISHNKIQIKLLTKFWLCYWTIQVVLILNKPILLLLVHGFYIWNTFGNWM